MREPIEISGDSDQKATVMVSISRDNHPKELMDQYDRLQWELERV